MISAERAAELRLADKIELELQQPPYPRRLLDPEPEEEQ